MTTETKNATPAKKSTKKPTLADLLKRVEELEAKVEELEARPTRDRGPKSERQMTEEDAERILLGDLAAVPHKQAAKELGLSYGQVYSARNGYTFKTVYKKYREANKKG